MSRTIKLGYETGTAREVAIPLRHTAVTGQTQESGKTTTLEAIITRSGLKAIAFITKRGESGFRLQAPIPPYFREPDLAPETPMWRWVESIFESIGETVGKDEKAAIIQASERVLEWEEYKQKGEKKRRLVQSRERVETLEQVAANVALMKQQARGKMQTALTLLNAYFQIVLPQIARLKASRKLELRQGVNVMNLVGLAFEMQLLVIRSVLEEIYLHGRRTVVIIPECAKIIPRMRSNPVRLTAELFIREGLGLGNVLMLDSQDLANVATEVLKSVGVWILGKQTERNEVKRVVDYIPEQHPNVSPKDIQQLGKGEFWVVYSDQVRKVYVQPAGMDDVHAQAIARGEESADSWAGIVKGLPKESGEWRVASGETEDSTDPEPRRADHSGKPCHPGPGRSTEERPSAEMPTGSTENEDSAAAADSPEQCDPGTPTGAEHIPPKEAPCSAPENIESEESMANDRLEARIRALEEENALLRKHMGPHVLGPECRTVGCGQWSGLPDSPEPRVKSAESQSAVAVDFQNLANGHFVEFLRRLRSHKEVIALVAQRPEIQLTLERPRVDWDASSTKGRISLLISERFFEQPRKAEDTRREFVRRGWFGSKTPTRNLMDAFAELSAMGFLTVETDGYKAVPEMKIHVRRATAGE